MSGNVTTYNNYTTILRQEDEVDDLVKLAEEISANLEYMQDRRKWLIISSSLIFTLAISSAYTIWSYFVMSNWSVEVLSLVRSLIAFFILASASVAIRRFYLALKMKNAIKIDAHILGRLLNMIDSSNRDLSKDSIVKKAYFDMRLSRINFKHAKFKKQAQSTSRVQQETTPQKPTESPVSTSV